MNERISTADGAYAWWRGCVVYECYVRSFQSTNVFQDTNGDCVGDLKGVTHRLPYLAELGVDAIWLTPFYPSPMVDGGYDVSNYCGVGKMFGTLHDFDALVALAHALGLKVLIDMVWSHTSDQHPWFDESRANRDNPKSDWYVWRYPKADGTPPNNWLSYFGGSAWSWDGTRQQYYLARFSKQQPALNLWNPEVRDVLRAVAAFWLDRRVDGFRMDAAHTFLYDPDLTDNPYRPPGMEYPDDLVVFHGPRPLSNPMANQVRTRSEAHPAVIELVEELRYFVDANYTDRVLLAEVGGEDSDNLAATLTAAKDSPGRLHMAYSFGLLAAELNRNSLLKIVTGVERLMSTTNGWICWTTGNHDVPRVGHRWGRKDYQQDPDLAKLTLALGLSLRGSFCLYQGEELGLTEAPPRKGEPPEVYGAALGFPGRNGCRTPMPWEHGAPNSGFTAAGTEPWLPIPQEHRQLAADLQQADPDSPWNFCKKFLAWRRNETALRVGSFQTLDTHDPVLAFVREAEGHTLVCAFNLSTDHALLCLSDTFERTELLDVSRRAELVGNASGLLLGPHGFAFMAVTARDIL